MFLSQSHNRHFPQSRPKYRPTNLKPSKTDQTSIASPNKRKQSHEKRHQTARPHPLPKSLHRLRRHHPHQGSRHRNQSNGQNHQSHRQNHRQSRSRPRPQQAGKGRRLISTRRASLPQTALDTLDIRDSLPQFRMRREKRHARRVRNPSVQQNQNLLHRFGADARLL